MTIPVISHSHEGVRINIDGIVDVFSNPVQIAESYARFKVTAREQMGLIAKNADAATQLLNFMRKVDTSEPLSEHEIETIVRQGTTVIEDLLYAIVEARKAIA